MLTTYKIYQSYASVTKNGYFMTSPLFKPLKAGALDMPNRIIMAPLTRGRAELDGTPTERMVKYYELRADAGLIISEATAISPIGHGWLNAPDIYNEEHRKGWQKITEAVHKKGGRMFLQLWHMGRISHPDFLNGQLPVAPSAIQPTGHTTTPKGKKDYVTPHALTVEEIKATVKDYEKATKLAIDAGFDGVEIHGANGYLIDEFLRDGGNKRSDEYGGTAENRAKFLREVVEIVTKTIGSNKTGLRLSPRSNNYGLEDSNPYATYDYISKMLNDYDLAYLHVKEDIGEAAVPGERVTPIIRQNFKNKLFINGGYTKESGEEALANGEADAIVYGKLYLANPDLVERFKTDAALNKPNPKTFYMPPTDEGYIDYPLLNEKAA